MERYELGSESDRYTLDTKYIAPMSHLYRGEMVRLTVYRQRLDAVTTWAVTGTFTLNGFILITSMLTHWAHLLVFLMQIVFSLIETNRYQNYLVPKFRNDLIVAGFYIPLLEQLSKDQYGTKDVIPAEVSISIPFVPPVKPRWCPRACWGHSDIHIGEGRWQEKVAHSFRRPLSPISDARAWLTRFRRIYVGLFFITLGAWLVKLHLGSNLEAAAIIPILLVYALTCSLVFCLLPEKSQDV